MVQELSALTGVPFEDMLVHNVQAANIKGRDCLTASLWITGENGVCTYNYVQVCIHLLRYIGGCEGLVALSTNISVCLKTNPLHHVVEVILHRF